MMRQTNKKFKQIREFELNAEKKQRGLYPCDKEKKLLAFRQIRIFSFYE